MADEEGVTVDRASALASAFPAIREGDTESDGADDAARRTRRRRSSAFEGLDTACGGCGECGACRDCDAEDDDDEGADGGFEPTGDSYHEEYTIETVARDPLDYLAGLLDDHCALVQRRAAARRVALNMTVCTQQVQAAEEDAAREAVRWTRLEEDTFLGDVRLRTVRQLLHEIDERGFERSAHQERFHDSFLRACSRVLYREEWAVHRTAIMTKNGWKSVCSEVMISTPRRFGKVRARLTPFPCTYEHIEMMMMMMMMCFLVHTHTFSPCHSRPIRMSPAGTRCVRERSAAALVGDRPRSRVHFRGSMPRGTYNPRRPPEWWTRQARRSSALSSPLPLTVSLRLPAADHTTPAMPVAGRKQANNKDPTG